MSKFAHLVSAGIIFYSFFLVLVHQIHRNRISELVERNPDEDVQFGNALHAKRNIETETPATSMIHVMRDEAYLPFRMKDIHDQMIIDSLAFVPFFKTTGGQLLYEEGGDEEEKLPPLPWQWIVEPTPPFYGSYAYEDSTASGSWKNVKGYRDMSGLRRPVEIKELELADGQVKGSGQDDMGKFIIRGAYWNAASRRPGDPPYGDLIVFYQQYLGTNRYKFEGKLCLLSKEKEEDPDEYIIHGVWSLPWDKGNFWLELRK